MRPLRPLGWEERLDAVVLRYRAAEFAWGTADCATFPADCAAAILAEDRVAGLRGYASKEEALRTYARAGVRDLGEGFALYFPEIPPAMAHRGDIGVVETEIGITGCVILGPYAEAVAQTGLLRFPRSMVKRAFQV